MPADKTNQQLLELCDQYAELRHLSCFVYDATTALLESGNHIQPESVEGLRLMQQQIKRRLQQQQNQLESFAAIQQLQGVDRFRA